MRQFDPLPGFPYHFFWSMRRRGNTLWAVLIAVVVIAAVVAAVLLRKRAAPEVARLLPDSDAVLYINLEPIRLFSDLGKKPPQEREPEYEDFVRGTGFEFERDLEKAAFAIHYGAEAKGRPADTRYSEVFQGKFDHVKVAQYLRKLSREVERYRDFDVYVIPHEDRVVRVVLLAYDLAAASNTDGSEVIHGIIDRQKEAALPFAGPALIGDYYRRVPFGSVVWMIARAPERGTADHSQMLLPSGWSGLLPKGSTVVASARPLTDIHVRVQVLTHNEAEAAGFIQQAGIFLALVQSLDVSMDGGGADPDVKAGLQSLELHQEKDAAVLTAKLPFGFFKKLVSEPPVEFTGEKQTQTAAPPQTKPAPRKKVK